MNYLNVLNAVSEATTELVSGSTTGSETTHIPGSGILDGTLEYDFGGAGLTTLVSIIIVFAVLIVIILITHFLFMGINKTSEAIDKSDSKFAKWLKRNKKPVSAVATAPAAPAKVEILDDDMMAAVLVATIDYQNEVKTDVKVVSVKEIK